MIRTGLPYSMSEMDEIKNNGAIVDMANIKFPNIPVEKYPRTTFVFLRNTGFDVTLDFSNCTFEQKEAFLVSYLSENIDVPHKEFSMSYIKILNHISGNNVDTECILTDEEIDLFIKNNNELIINIFQLIKSLPLFAMFCFMLNNQVYNLDDFEKTDEVPFSDNIYRILSNESILSLFDNDIEIVPTFYTKLFHYDNRKLLEVVITKLPLFGILYGLSTTDQTKWESVIENFNNLESGFIEDNSQPV